MKYLLTFITFFAFAVSLNAQQNEQPIYIGTWVGIEISESLFRSPYAVVIKDTALLLIRKNIALRDRIQDLDNPNFLQILDSPGKCDTLALNYFVKAVNNGFQFRLSPKQKVVGKDTSIMAEFRINKTVSSSNHSKASFSIDFKDGSKKVNTLKLIKL
jgi:hypothetical protein